MDLNRLRRLAAEVDDEHHEAMRSLHDDLGNTIFAADAETRASRRSFLRGLGLGGAVLTVGTTTIAMSAVTAGAQTTTTTPPAATTTTTTPPKQPTNEDLVILAFAQSLELAAVQAYVLAAPKLAGSGVLPIALAFAGHHEQHAQAFAGLAGKAALGIANQSILAVFGPLIEAARTETEVLKIAFDLETTAASTYVAVLGQLEGTNPATTVASILPIEARHAVVIGQALELPLDEISPSFETPDDGVTPSEYPIVAR